MKLSARPTLGRTVIIALAPVLILGLYALGTAQQAARGKKRATDGPGTAKSQKGSTDDQQPSAPQYNDAGELKLPADYATWVFVGANMGIEYRKKAEENSQADAKFEVSGESKAQRGNFHNVYINPEAYAHFVKTGEFPEKTVFVLDVYEGKPGEPKNVVADGLFPGKQLAIVLAVKNSVRPDGSKTDWAYYDFAPDQATAKALPDADCYDCHLQHAERDNVWVQFYPMLRKHLQR